MRVEHVGATDKQGSWLRRGMQTHRVLPQFSMSYYREEEEGGRHLIETISLDEGKEKNVMDWT